MSEHLEQKSLFTWAGVMEKKFPVLKLMFAIPNGGQRHKATAIKLKKEGVKAGVWDVFLPAPRYGYHGLFIEMKYGRNKLTPEQKEFRVMAESQGYKCEVAYSWIEAKKIIEDYI